MNLTEFFSKWHISRQQLAERMDMLKGTFHNKFTDNHPTKFSDAELERLMKLLEELKKDIAQVHKTYKYK